MQRLEESKAGEIKEMLSTILWEEHKMIPQEWLPATIPASIESIFEDLERTYDEILIRTTLGLLTYSRGGVSK